MRRLPLARVVFIALLILPHSVFAHEGEAPSYEHPSILSYGFDGLIDGATIGLAVGYLSTGPHYQSREWRKLVIGTGVGAIAGLGIGITLAVVDDSVQGPGLGMYALRDTGYGTILGALSGAVIGALFYVGSDHPKDVLVGASIGAIVGTGVGIAIGIIEGSNARRRYARLSESKSGLRLSLGATTTVQGDPVLMPTLRGWF
jgi:hypothetical protein